MKIYTKAGDKGTTSLIGGERVDKDDVRVEAYGTVDELCAEVALLQDMLRVGDNTLSRVETVCVACTDDLIADLTAVLTDLMCVEALLAVGKGGEGKVTSLGEERIAWIEQRIDRLTDSLKPLHSFTVGGGHVWVSQASVCRTVCRRAERRAISASKVSTVQPNVLRYINRLSDYLYTLSRVLADRTGVELDAWLPD